MARLSQRMLAALLLLAPLSLGCERADDVNGVALQPSRSAAVSKRTSSAVILSRVITTTSGTVRSTWVTSGKASALQLGKYHLEIPRGAVKQPTVFEMTVLEGSMIAVRLRAYDRYGVPVRQFTKPLRLTLPYDEADRAQVGKVRSLRIANVAGETNATILELLTPSVDRTEQTVTASLTHFSVWSLAKELSPGID